MYFPKNRKIGRFEIDFATIDKQPDIVQSVLGNVIVIDTDMRIDRQVIEYLAICDDFDEVPEAAQAPTYDIEIAEDGVVNWKKQG